MRSDVGSAQHYVQETMRIFLHAAVKVVIDPQPPGLAGTLDQFLEQRLIEELHVLHEFILDGKRGRPQLRLGSETRIPPAAQASQAR